MSRLLKEPTHRLHIPGHRPAHRSADLPDAAAAPPGTAPAAGAPTRPERLAGHEVGAGRRAGTRAAAAAAGILLVAATVVWGASVVGEDSTPSGAPTVGTPTQYHRMAGGGVPIGP